MREVALEAIVSILKTFTLLQLVKSASETLIEKDGSPSEGENLF
jgi:hypothetical protein